MIPHRIQSDEIFGLGLKGRVTACRKRLRVNRSAQKVQSNDDPLACGGEATAGFLDEYPAVRESSVGRQDASEFRDGKAWQASEQEVGIT
jgi:hypothetical protein